MMNWCYNYFSETQHHLIFSYSEYCMSCVKTAAHALAPPSALNSTNHVSEIPPDVLPIRMKDAVEVQAFSRLLEVLTRLSDDLQTADEESVALQLQLIAECFRAQRNSCVQSTRNQKLLEQVHAIGKASKNIFSAAQNFSSFSGDGDISSHSPVISFKAHLIRLIGNLCHSNANNQNKVRELEGIPLILDNCNIDSNNPFISQWAIFAIRNLLENNTTNQKVVAELERHGPADYSALRELGFLVEERDGSLLLKPTRKDS
ncbi:hypothetical protein INR49_026569 [Caranx melampygus]|nr:hypothetical protein INR49_026569 [Caranx melampygus]